MRIGILGNGLMAEALGGQWAKAGHEIFVGGRSPQRARKLAEQLSRASRGTQPAPRGGTLQEAAQFGPVVLLAVPAEAAIATVQAVDLRGRTLIDCTNAITHPGVVLAVDAMAETISRYADQARVVKAFNLAADSVWRRAPQPGQRLGVPICGDDREALDQVAVLVRDLGCEPIHAGGLQRARLLEATAAFAIGVWAGGGDTRELFPPRDQAF
ncbi:NADP oxidoreductase [Kribbella sp. ALI-6-A]|uniref:NADPH-dependent F420 reductase n=1 Tax=Kribbella sp. ALI-6-A TaxID=1933817 RepID=UPI00097C1538|nr:NAD(P)-binding domain-containing protein [Kribbella sp. ALI-6-A]ONI69313.1 NADP oxidoreductase [Kribbella sp. ALI-6-A]